MGTMNMVLMLIGLSVISFVLYVVYHVKTQGTSSTKDEESVEDLQLIDKMKEIQLIQTTKQVQSLATKNKLFQRSFANVYGAEELKNIVAEKPQNQTNQQDISKPNEYEQNYGISAKTLDDTISEQSTDPLVPNEDNSLLLNENEIKQMQENYNKTQELNSEVFEEPEDRSKKHKLEDEYDAEQHFVLQQMLNTHKAMFN